MGMEETVTEDFLPAAATPPPPERSRSIDRDRLTRAAASFAATMLISFGAGLPLLRAMDAAPFAIVIALAAALGSRRALDAALAAPLGLLVGAYSGPWHDRSRSPGSCRPWHSRRCCAHRSPRASCWS